jgi:two-component system chemotaxis sensor kinase CheA
MGDEAARLEFLARAEELTDALYADLRLLRSAAAGRERRALLDRAFRHAHTLKGSAAARPDASSIVRLAHGLEDLLDAARAGRVTLDDATLDACESAADSLSRSLDDLAHNRPNTEVGTDEPAERLRALLLEAEARANSAPKKAPEAAITEALKSLPDEIAAHLSEAERRRLAAAAGEGLRVVSVRVAFDLGRLDEDFRRLGYALEESCEIAATLPGAPDADEAAPRVSFNLVCATSESPDALARRLAGFGAKVALLFDAVTPADADAVAPEDGEAGEAVAVAESLDSVGESLENEAGVAAVGGAGAPASVPGFVRVPLAELDELAFAASELFDDTSAALEAARLTIGIAKAAGAKADGVTEAGGATEAEREKAEGAAEATAELERRAARLRQDFLALEERVLALRMQPLAPVLERAARAGRAAARAAGKGVEIEAGGGHARVDRAVAERIVEPLVHLMRNAVDHGVESAAERRAAGKSERGRVRLRSAAEGASVRVTVEDDGRGVDLAGVERAARAAGIVPAGAGVTEEQALRLIFRPGFSTAGQVTETSGRGVGLDAVERAVELAGGEVRVRTRAGRGTTFELRLPLALALLPVVLVESDGETYAADAALVVETGRLESSAITSGGARSRAAWRGRELPFVSLTSLLGRATADASNNPMDGATREGDVDNRVSVVVVRAGEAGARDGVRGGRRPDTSEQMGAAGERADESGEGTEDAALVVVAVDRVAGRRDALVRGLGRHATRWRGVGGAIDLRDGGVALLLDLASLVEMREGGR